MTNRSVVVLGIAALAAAVGVGWGIGQLRKGAKAETTANLEQKPASSGRGALLFQATCAQCHGPEGRGDGDAVATLKPPPRDFAARPWRLEPTKESIRQTIQYGIPGTAMPASQRTFAPADLDALVNHVYELATSRPVVVHERSLEEQLLQAAGFTDLQGTDPPPLTVSDAAGRVTKLADLKGRLVIVNFWGTTCVHCWKEMPGLRKLEAEYSSRGLTVLYVCADADDPKEAQVLLDNHVPGIKGQTEETGLGLARFEVQALPTIWVIGPDGKAIGRTSGAVHWQSPDLRKVIDRWLP